MVCALSVGQAGSQPLSKQAALSVRLVTLALEASARSVQQGRRRILVAAAVKTARWARRVSAGSAASVTVALNQAWEARAASAVLTEQQGPVGPATTAHLGNTRVQTARRARTVLGVRSAQAAARASTASRLGSTLQTESRVWCVMRARSRRRRRWDVWSATRYPRVSGASVQHVRQGRRRTLMRRTVTTAWWARRVSAENAVSATMALNQAWEARAALAVMMGLPAWLGPASSVRRAPSRALFELIA